MIETLGLVAGSGWASGLNLYLAVLILGFSERLGWTDIPDVLGRTDVMIVAGTLFVVEFVADKVPYLDNVWDAIHTFIRPAGAAALGAVLAGESGSIGTALGAVISGGLALDSHAAKATTRVVANTSPEPFSNIILSLVEDLGAALLVVLSLLHPAVALVVVAVLVVAATALTIWLWRMARRSWAKIRERGWLRGAGR